MKVLFVHREPTLASARVRVLGLVPYLRSLGLECETALHPGSPLALRRLVSRSGADVVVMQKKTPSAFEGLAWRSGHARIVFDYDDAVMFRQSPRSGSWESSTRRARFRRAVRLADAFVCGNGYLASFCAASGKPVLIAASPVPLDVPEQSGTRDEGPLRVGWIGAPHNLGELAALAPSLRELAREVDFALVVISEESIALDGIRVQHVPWSLESQEEELARLDVGLMPLVDSPWARGKCAYKLLQYMAAGVPAVGSAVGMNAELIEHDRNGLLAEGPDGFAAAIRDLHDDPERAARLGAAGRATVEERFSYPVIAAAWKDFLTSL